MLRDVTFNASQSERANHLPDPATPTVAAPAPMNLAAESMSRVTGVVWNDRTCGSRATGAVFWAASVWLWEMTALLIGRMYALVPLRTCVWKKFVWK